MVIDKASFFVVLGSLAAGGAGGYVAGEHGVLQSSQPTGVTEQQRPSLPASEPLAVAESPATPPAPSCDDSSGAAAACPAPGYPSEEGGCGALPTNRCQDFKQAMKPRVAERAVACLNALDPGQRCDANRLNLCAHEALMNACQEPEPIATGALPTDELASRCMSIEQSCGVASFAPTRRECRAVLTGLSAFGRDQMATCMKTHCGDKGLIGCEAVVAK